MVFCTKVEKSFWHPSPIPCSRFFLHFIGSKLPENHGGSRGLVNFFFLIFGAHKKYFCVEMHIYQLLKLLNQCRRDYSVLLRSCFSKKKE